MRFSSIRHVRQQILHYVLARGGEKKLPSIRSLAMGLKVSTKTVQEAVHLLTGEGVIEARGRRGLYVKSIVPMAGKGRRIGLLMAGKAPPAHPWPGNAVDILSRELKKAGYELIVRSLADLNVLNMADEFERLNFAGVVTLEVNSDLVLSALTSLRVPLVSMDHNACHLGIPSVAFKNALGGFQATRHVLAQGHRHVAFFRPLTSTRIGSNVFMDRIEDERMLGYQIAMEDAGLPEIVMAHRVYEESFRSNMDRMLSRSPAPTAFICTDDHFAWLAGREVQRRGIRIPEEISVTGFGDSGAEFAPGKRITSVWLDMKGMGRSAARMLLEILEGKASQPGLTTLQSALHVHDSVAGPSAERGMRNAESEKAVLHQIPS